MAARRIVRGMLRPLACAFVIAATALALYSPILLPQGATRFPWAYDTWGHLLKVEFLLRELRWDNLYPDVHPDWYAGMQLFRYYAPAPYYAMAPLYALTGDVVLTGNLYVVGCALLGALSCLLYAPRLGWGWATLGGVLGLLAPDNVRVALAEGNLPRLLAIALLPALVWTVLNALERGARRRDLLGLALLMALVVLSHAMMAAIFAACCSLLVLAYWVAARAPFRTVRRSLLGLGLGLLLSAWWLLPSLAGGITEIDAQASGEAIARFPVGATFGPFRGAANREEFYIGASLLAVVLLGVVRWRILPPLARALLVAGGATLLVASTLLLDAYLALPLSSLFWPIRFTSFVSFCLLLCALFLGHALWTAGCRPSRLAALALVAALTTDFAPSRALIWLEPVDPAVAQVGERLGELPGWRVAAADLSALGSTPSYLWTSKAGREQVYGWAYQGAATARLVSSVNEAMEEGYGAYAVDRLEQLGTDDVAVTTDRRIQPAFARALRERGYAPTLRADGVTLYHKHGGPRGHLVRPRVLGIGEGARNAAYMFPEIALGSSSALDSYDLPFLRRFDTLLLSRFSWNRKADAEALVREYVRGGGRVVADLTAAPIDALAREPEFLGVYAEPAYGITSASLTIDGRTTALAPFPPAYTPWVADLPQGLDVTRATVDYLGMRVAVLGEKRIGTGSITVVGLNLLFHALATDDPLTTGLIARELRLDTGAPPPPRSVPFEGYEADSAGYRFTYDTPRGGQLLVPVAQTDSTRVTLDGREAPHWGLDRLVLLDAEPGRHTVTISNADRSGVYGLGRIVSGGSAIALLALVLRGVSLPRLVRTPRRVTATETV